MAAARARRASSCVYVAPERLVASGVRDAARAISSARSSRSTRRTASASGATTSGPSTWRSARWCASCRGARVLACTATATPVVRDEILARLGLDAGDAAARARLRAPEPRAPRARGRRARASASARSTRSSPRRSARPSAPRGRGDRLRADAARDRGGGRARSRRAAGAPPPTTPASTPRCATRCSQRFVGARRRRRRRDERVRHGHRSRRRPRGRAPRAARLDRGVLPGGRPRGPRRRATRSGSSSSRRATCRSAARCSSATGLPTPELVRHKWSLFLELLRYAEGGSCRHDAILRYFGDEEETLAGCGRCDVCRSLGERRARSDAETTTLDRAQGALGGRAHPRPLRPRRGGEAAARRDATRVSRAPASTGRGPSAR